MNSNKPFRPVILLLQIIVLCYVGVCAYLYSGQERMMYPAAPGHPNMVLLGDNRFTEVNYIALDGQTLFAFYREADRNMPTILFLHGNTGMHLAGPRKVRWLAEQGYGVMAASYRGYGGNDGTPSETGLHNDAVAALTYLLTERRIDPRDIVVYGESLGTGVATRLMAEYTDANPGQPMKALILDAPFTSVLAVAEDRYPILPISMLLRDRYDSLTRVNRIGVPLLIMTGEKDAVVPNYMAHLLFDRAKDPKRIEEFPEGGHSDLYDYGAGDKVNEFLNGLKK